MDYQEGSCYTLSNFLKKRHRVPGKKFRHMDGFKRIDIEQTGVNGRNWIDSALVNTELNFRVPQAMEFIIKLLCIIKFYS